MSNSIINHNKASLKYYYKNRQHILNKMKSKRETDRKEYLQWKIEQLKKQLEAA